MATEISETRQEPTKQGSIDELAVDVMTLVLGLMSVHARAFADLPDAKTENPNTAAGRQAIKAKDFNSAVKSLTKAVQENPKDADAHTCSVTVIETRHFRQIAGAVPEALKIDANHPKRAGISGELYLDMNQPANAKKQLRVLKSLVPPSANARSTKI